MLPFANMSGDPEQGYFADGIVEEIITALSRIRWLSVIARNSSFTYKGKNVIARLNRASMAAPRETVNLALGLHAAAERVVILGRQPHNSGLSGPFSRWPSRLSPAPAGEEFWQARLQPKKIDRHRAIGTLHQR